MPRNEKTGRKLEHFFEIIPPTGRAVYTAQGKRNVGDSEWTIKDSDVRANLLPDEEAAAQWQAGANRAR